MRGAIDDFGFLRGRVRGKKFVNCIFEVFYWRERNDEVDFVLRKKGSVIAIEIKSNAEKRTEGLEKFKVLFHPKASFIIGEGGITPEDFFMMDLNRLF